MCHIITFGALIELKNEKGGTNIFFKRNSKHITHLKKCMKSYFCCRLYNYLKKKEFLSSYKLLIFKKKMK